MAHFDMFRTTCVLFGSILIISSNLPTCTFGVSYCPAPTIPSAIRVWAIPNSLYNPGPPASGFLVDLLNALQVVTGIPYTIEAHNELTFASPQGNFTGSILQPLIDKACDLVGPDITITSAREAVVDYLLPFNLYNIQLVVNTDFGLNNQTQYLSADNADLALLLKSKNATLNAIYDNVNRGRPGSIISGLDDMVVIRKVASGNFAYIGESATLASQVFSQPDRPKNVAIYDPNLGTYYVSMAVQQGSPLTEPLNRAIEQITEEGTMRILKHAAGIALFQTSC